LRVLTWNVLFELYERDRVHNDERMPQLANEIMKSNADVVVLQEV